MSLAYSCFAFLCFCLFLGASFSYFLHLPSAPFLKNKTRKPIVLLFVFMAIVCVNLFVYHFSSSENYIYTWDYATYWYKSMLFSDLFFHSPLNALKELYFSILNEDYAYTPSVLLSPLLHFWDKTYPVYVLSVLNMYYIPAFLLFLYLFYRISASTTDPVKDLFGNAVFFLLFTTLLSPVLYGYIDAVILPFASLFLIIAYQEDFSHINWKRNLLVGLLLTVFLLERRWFTFWFVSFFVSLGIVYVLKYLADKEEFPFQRLIDATVQLVCIFCFSLALLAVLFHDFFMRTFFNEFNDIYSAYNSGNWQATLGKAFSYFGPLVLSLGGLGIIYGVQQKNTRWFTLFLCFHLVCTYLLFTYIQDFGVHQYYLLAVVLIVLCKLGMNGIAHLFTRYWNYHITQGALLLLLGAQFTFTYLPKANIQLQALAPIFSNVTLFPRTRPDIPSIKDLVYYVQSVSSCPKKSVYAIGSSGTFNDQVVRHIYLPKEYNPIRTLARNRDVDKRDGFPIEALKADIILLAWPLQYHLRPEDQMTVVEIGKLIKNNSGKGKSYELLKTFSLENHVEVEVYEKMKALPSDSIHRLKEKFLKRYADYPHLVDFGTD